MNTTIWIFITLLSLGAILYFLYIKGKEVKPIMDRQKSDRLEEERLEFLKRKHASSRKTFLSGVIGSHYAKVPAIQVVEGKGLFRKYKGMYFFRSKKKKR